jgi:hypothetical protein
MPLRVEYHLSARSRQIVATICLLLTISLSGCFDPRGEFVEFQANVKTKVNPEELQKWVVPIIEGRDSQYPIQPRDVTIGRADIPSFLKSVISDQPELAMVRDEGKADGSIMILWGGGFYHFGLLVGKSGYKPSGVAAMSITFWKDGIYFAEQNQ